MAADHAPDGVPGQWTLVQPDSLNHADASLGDAHGSPQAASDQFATGGSAASARPGGEPPMPPPGVAPPPPPPSAAAAAIGDLPPVDTAPESSATTDRSASPSGFSPEAAELPRPPAFEVGPDAILGTSYIEEESAGLPLPAPPPGASDSTFTMLQEMHRMSASTAQEILDVSEVGGSAYVDPADAAPISEDMTITGRRRRSRGKFRLR